MLFRNSVHKAQFHAYTDVGACKAGYNLSAAFHKGENNITHTHTHIEKQMV